MFDYMVVEQIDKQQKDDIGNFDLLNEKLQQLNE
jgi:hypothetical protein